MHYDLLNERAAAVGLPSGVSEGHGLFCGLLCGGAEDPEAQWLSELLEELDGSDLLVRELEDGLHGLSRETREAIDGPGMGFSPLLPDDSRPLRQRAEALRDWCRGFLYGLGLAGVGDGTLSADTAEVLHDLSEIARMDSDLTGDSEEDEEAYAELSEFVWVAAMLILEERSRGNEHDVQ